MTLIVFVRHYHAFSVRLPRTFLVPFSRRRTCDLFSFTTAFQVLESSARLTAFPGFRICHKDALNIFGLCLRKVPKRRSLIRAFRDSCGRWQSYQGMRESFDGIVRYMPLGYTLMSPSPKKKFPGGLPLYLPFQGKGMLVRRKNRR